MWKEELLKTKQNEQNREAESVAVTSQGRVWGSCGPVCPDTSVRLCSACGWENFIKFTLIHEYLFNDVFSILIQLL